jgi:hypothetical protein
MIADGTSALQAAKMRNSQLSPGGSSSSFINAEGTSALQAARIPVKTQQESQLKSPQRIGLFFSYTQKVRRSNAD